MKRWFEFLLSVALVGAWAAVALTASDATVREDVRPAEQVRATPALPRA